jgi:type IV pilus assembly protein PilY1
MNRRTIAIRASLLISLVGMCVASDHSFAQSNADYAAQPQFISNVVSPNILIIMDNSGSMSNRACESSSCGVLSSGATSTVTTFVATTRYNGFADPLRCYVWDATDKRFENGAVKAALNTACPGTEWDGNFVNWTSFRRFDAVKKAMTGGNCWHPTASPVRNADGTCKPSGTPSLPTVKVQNLGTSTETTPAIPYSGGTGDLSYVGRIPAAVHPGNPANLYVQIQGNGDLCIDDDNGGGCPDGGGFAETELLAIAFAMYSEPTGVVQQVGAKARFGLAVFNGAAANDGIRVLTPIGSRQSINFSGTTVETFNTNTAAMIDSVDESSPATWTPLAESLYEAVRYVAQLNSNYYPTSYVYPIAFSGSGGVSFATAGVGSIGTAEVSSLSGSEPCPAGYISGGTAATCAAGRDPYFFGSNHTPAWASTSQQVVCCKTFVIVFTDGEPTQDLGIPAALQDYGHAHHGVHCINSDPAAPPRPIDGTCNSNTATPFNELLGEHKTDYASSGSGYLDSVAYWAHTNDLRPCSGTADGTIAVINVTGHCLPGTQNVSVYTFFAFGNVNGRGILSQTAKLGAFEDSNSDGIPQTNEWDKENNYTGVSTPDGIPDAYFESSNVDDLQDKMLATIASILRKSAAGSSVSVLATSTTGEGALYQSYFYPSTIENSTLVDITWTGYTQSLFIDTFGNLREDTVQDKKLNYREDKILVTRYDTVANLVKVDYYDDLNGDGLPDDKDSNGTINSLDCLPCDQLLSSIKPVWEAGKQLALKDASTRTLLTWVDTDNDGVIDSGEQIPFTAANSPTLGPYLRAAATAPFTAGAIINFIRGCEPSVCADQAGLRDRRLQVPAGSGTLKTWKLGDLIHSAPQVVSSPSDRYDAKVGDLSYQAYLVKYHNRRQVIYAGANDGMLHAFNGGYYHPGDDPTTGTSASPIVEHGWFTRTPTDNSAGPQLGDELWGFIPYQLLPQLQWLTRADYQHMYFVDLQPTVADVRIFTPDTDHPNGWGTILIGGMRMGGSCRGAVSPAAPTCVGGTGAPPMSVTADFGSGVQTRKFYSAYFVLDITNPEVEPTLLMSFTDEGLGLTTSLPKVVRVNPSADGEVSNTNAKWYMVVGSGPTGYGGGTTQSAAVYAVNLATGPGASNSLVQKFSVGSWNSFIGDMASFDRNLDYRTDAVYFGRVVHDGSLPWRGKLYRLTLGETVSGSNPPVFGTQAASAWGIASGANRIPTEILDTFTGTCVAVGCTPPTIELGPVATAPGIAIDDAAKVWVFAGSGRYYSSADKTDTTPQYFVGVKDSVINLVCTQSNSTNCQDDDLLDVTSATVCIVGQGNCGQVAGTNQVTGVTGASSFTSLVALIQSKDGWYTTLPQSGAANGERVLASPVVFGGIVYFPTFIPTNDICASSGTSYLYSLYYKTGSAYQESIVGTTPGASGNMNVNGKTSLGEGLAFGGVTHVGSGSDGGAPLKICNNTSTGALLCTESDMASGGDSGTGGTLDPRSHFISWIYR